MSLLTRLSLAFKALRQLGPGQVGLFAWYQFEMRSGLLKRKTKDRRQKAGLDPSSFVLRPVFALPEPEELAAVLGEHAPALLSEADEIASGQVRLFGGPPVLLRLKLPGELEHWTAYEGSARSGASRTPHSLEFEGDIKFIWEPGRFGWAFTLGRAYQLSGEERYARAFWEFTENFLDANPPHLGPHWSSAQEVALRLLSFVFAAQVFAPAACSTPERLGRLAEAVAEHAARIPPTLAYARAQNNNHQLTEALGLYTASVCLPGHPEAPRWRGLGWRWLHHALQTQISPDGTYIQHSTNYHRLMLQAAVWAKLLAAGQGQSFPELTNQRLAAAVRWLLALLETENGQVPNLGPNDGAYIFPLASSGFQDYRPALQASAAAFLRERLFPPGPWDEMALWFGLEGSQAVRLESRLSMEGKPSNLSPFQPATSSVIRLPHHSSWAYLRSARFTSRPGHADQLHLDLWWRGLNVAQDAGTYLYNAPPPWDNALARTGTHNTVTVAGQDQMQRAGRFLWLDWAQGLILAHERAPDGSWERLSAQHDGYRRLGVLHRRDVTAFSDGRWIILDHLLPEGRLKVQGSRSQVAQSAQNLSSLSFQPSNLQPSTFRLHWLLPDWPWVIENREERIEILLDSPYGRIVLRIRVQDRSPLSTFHSPTPQLVRAGELLHGSGPVSPVWGWTSPTYGCKIPALSFSLSVKTTPPFHFTSEWIFPDRRMD